MSDSRRFSRSLAAVGLFMGPLLFFLGTLVDPAWGDDQAAYLEAVAGAPAGTFSPELFGPSAACCSSPERSVS